MKPDKRMPCDAAETNHDARMLDRIILIEQSRANCADVLPLAQSQHLLDEILRNQLGIII